MNEFAQIYAAKCRKRNFRCKLIYNSAMPQWIEYAVLVAGSCPIANSDKVIDRAMRQSSGFFFQSTRLFLDLRLVRRIHKVTVYATRFLETLSLSVR
jgi:hypothetical protein